MKLRTQSSVFDSLVRRKKGIKLQSNCKAAIARTKPDSLCAAVEYFIMEETSGFY